MLIEEPIAMKNMKRKKNLLPPIEILLILLTCLLIVGIFIEIKSSIQQAALAEEAAEAASIAEVQNRIEENTQRKENLMRKAPFYYRYVDQFLESYGSDSAGWHIEVINRIYPYLEYREIGDRVQLIFTPEADAQLTDRDLEKIWGDELVGFYDDVYDNVITEDLHEHEDHYDYDDYDDSDADDGNNSPGYHTVEGYTRTNSDGSSTHVDGYIRSNPDGDKSNNLSSPN
jgi:hypothetical protein